MSLDERLPVEPLPEERWDRIEEAVFAELDQKASSLPPTRRRPRRLVIVGGAIAGAVALAAAIALVLWTGEEATPASIYSSRVVSGADAVHTTVGDATLDVGPRAALMVVGDETRGWVVSLERGEVGFGVPPREGRPPFVVQAGDVRVEVVGTRFSVSREGDEVTVEVREGVVRVTRGAEAARVAAGERWPAPAAEPPSPSAEELAGREQEELEDWPPGSPRGPGGVAAEGGRGPRSDANARAIFERAQAAEADDPARSATLYRRATRHGGPWAVNALYAWARLEVERGHDVRGRRLLRRYLDRHPDGPNATDARELLARLERTERENEQ